MLGFLKNLRKGKAHAAFTFSRPLVLLQSDDWGRVGVRDKEGFELLRAQGIRLGEHPYDLYSMETADDVTALAELLRRHHDSLGRSPCITLNFCTANLDFPRMRRQGLVRVIPLPLSKGLPGTWSRPGLLDAYREGIKQGVFHPGLHSTVHFSELAVAKALVKGGERAELLHTLWKAETPYIFWRMPWVGYEYWSPEEPHNGGFLTSAQQKERVNRACQTFSELFGAKPVSACAPGYRSNSSTRRAWSETGIRVVENGTGDGLRPPHVDHFNSLHLFRNLDFEPSQHELDIDKYLEVAAACFAQGLPLIISTHSINFHSTLKDFRTSTIATLDRLLSALESRYPELLYVKDDDLHRLVTEGAIEEVSVKIQVTQREWNPNLAQMGAL